MEQGYYRLIERIDESEDRDGNRCEVGSLWYLSEIEGDEVTLIQGEHTWTFSLDTFLDHFAYAPEGIRERQDELADLMSSLHAVGDRQDNLIESASTPKLLADNTRPAQRQPTSTDLVAMASRTNPAIAAKNLKRVKTAFAVTKNQIAKRHSALQTLIQEQALILKAKTAILTRQIEMAQEAIYMINVYLGQDEEIVRIKSGEPASEDEKIVIRQQVLFMDEESAVAADFAKRGGLDFKAVEEFDTWVSDPEHLKQVLPEVRGVVAIKPRRNPKFYDDNPFVNSELNRQNKCLYILIRNGENLYRIHTTLWVDEVFLPRKDEFEHFFYESHTDWDTHDKVKKPLTPGSAKYMQAMDKAEAKKRRFYTVLIMIQGLLDRTKVFHPLPINEPINVCNLEGQKHVTLRYDAENLLGTGRPDFDKWLNVVNGELEVGCRIIGEFEGYYAGRRDLNERQGTKHAYRPSSDEIHIIDRKVDERSFRFLYKSDHNSWKGRDQSAPRVSYLIYKADDFIINIDSVTVADIEFYIRSRTNRHHYLNMIPLLKVALAIKKKEAEEEAPFRQLLIGIIAGKHDVSFARAERSVDALIKWWKFKTREHRALLSEDAKALRMIVAEFGRRKLLDNDALTEAHEQAVEKLLDDRTLAVFYRPDKSYAVLRCENSENVWIREEIWKLCADTQLGSVLASTNGENIIRFDCGVFVRRASMKEWTVVDKRHESWQLVWSHTRWNEWLIGARSQEHLTDAERKQAADYALAELADVAANPPEWSEFLDGRREHGRRPWLKPLAVTADPKDESVCLYYLQYHASMTKKLMTGRVESPECATIRVRWEKKQDELHFRLSGCRGIAMKSDDLVWRNQTVVTIFEDSITSFVAEEQKAEKAKKKERLMRRPIHAIEQKAYELIRAAWYEEQRTKFLEDYVDDDGDLWEDHKEDLSVPSNLWPRWIENMVGYVIERGVDINGWTINKLYYHANQYGCSVKVEEIEYYEKVKDMEVEYVPATEDDDDEDY
ncbi:MAG: hypothetical protein WC919_01195 [Candidatus Paceibacterota bacterium]